MILWLAALAHAAAPVGFDRIDLLSEDNPGWLADELPHAELRPEVTAVRYLEQVELVWSVPVLGIDVGTSFRAQSLQWERSLVERVGLHGTAAVITRLGLPIGGRLGLSVRRGPVRIGASVVGTTSASWALPEYSGWRVLPGVGIGVGPRSPESKAPWM